MEENIVKCEVYLDRIFYPKYTKSVDSGEYAIFSAIISKRLENCNDNLNQIKLKGNVCKLEFGTTYKVFAKLSEQHEQYGDTYEIVYISKVMDISSKDKQREFLRNILNENLVDKLFDTYDDVIKLLEEKDVASLVKIKGIGNQVALKLIDEYEESKDYSSIYLELGTLGFTSTFIKKLVDFYNSPDTVIDVVKNNPYDLVRVDGIGFKTADNVACKVGIDKYDIRRIKGFMIHFLNEQGEAGKSYLYYQELMQALYDTLGFVPEEVVKNTAKLMIENEDVVVLDEGNKIALKKYYNLEKNIMNELIRLQIGNIEIVEYNESEIIDNDEIDTSELHKDYVPKSFNISNWEDIIKNVEELQGFEFTEEQLSAIRLSLYNNVMTLTGLAGAGKTATANGICSLYDTYNIIACALSGKASVRITEATGLPASTIHRTLCFQNGVFLYNKKNKLAVDIVIIDEATMINGSLFLALLEAIPTGAKVIIMGDVQQLTPIGNCQVFADILNSNVLPVVKLTKPHRQALRSGIIPTSIKIASQEQIFTNSFEGNEILGELQDMELDITSNKESLSDLIINHFQTEMNKINDIMEVQICVPKRLKGDLSCYNLNNKIQNIYNPKFSEDNELEIIIENKKDNVKKYIIRKGDKVINTKNNYKSVNSNGDVTPVFNGNIGIVKDINKDNYCTIDFAGIGEVVLNRAESKNLELGYACTVHKCITEDTWLYTSDGLKQLKDFNNGANLHESKLLATKIKVFNGVELEKPLNFYNAGKSECRRIITQRGYELTGTLDHKIDVIGDDGYIKVKYFKDLTTEDYVLLGKNMNVYGDNIKLPSDWAVQKEDLYHNAMIYENPTMLTIEFARFLGYMVADGVVSKSGIKYGKNHKNVVDDFNNIVSQIFGYNNYKEPKNVLSNGSMGGMYLSEINSMFIQKYCTKIDGIQPNNKYVPNIILKAPKQFQIEFLRGVFEDGSVCIKNNKFDHISFVSINEKLINQIRYMLLNLGIVTTKFYREQKGKGSYTLFIYGDDCDIFIKTIGFISTEKQEKAFKLYDRKYSLDTYSIPYVIKVVSKILKENNLKIKEVDRELHRCMRKDTITNKRLIKFLDICDEKGIKSKDVDYLKDICYNSDVQQIKQINTTYEHTYCLEMPITHKFLQNGIRAWNCQGSGFSSTIVGIDNGSYIMNNCELLYTAITRAKKYCVLVANNYAVKKAIQTKEVKTKQTFLRDMLIENKYRVNMEE
ncbi:AAA family ATPase [Anaerocolumna aminovalerica]|uniref:AAA family ATPase n=1 Tax=Anaerocolumna aminovalerica TaxID=1527 RepID=UPI001C0F2701|nr:AAA family ATPase [Anaerocolumna aminovalerica]MBU5331715.1 AAA family ATPase [Anaerocolumna aminovalerica]